jgi:hypothetical protein
MKANSKPIRQLPITIAKMSPGALAYPYAITAKRIGKLKKIAKIVTEAKTLVFASPATPFTSESTV